MLRTQPRSKDQVKKPKRFRVKAFDKSIQKTNIWLKDLMKEMGWSFRDRTNPLHREHAYALLRATLHSLRDGMNNGAAAHLGAQLPMLIRGFYYEGWKPTSRARGFKDHEAFFDSIKENFGPAHHHIDVQHGFHAVLRVMQKHISQGELDNIKATLPRKLQAIWPEHVVLPH